MPKITFLIGIPCSGKTTYVNNLSDYNLWKISRDDSRHILFGLRYKQNNLDEIKVTKHFNILLKYAVDSKEDIIIDNVNLKKKYIDEILKQVPKSYKVEYKFFDVSLIKAYYRNFKRYITIHTWIPIKVIWNMYKQYKQIDKTKYI